MNLQQTSKKLFQIASYFPDLVRQREKSALKERRNDRCCRARKERRLGNSPTIFESMEEKKGKAKFKKKKEEKSNLPSDHIKIIINQKSKFIDIKFK